MRESNSLLRGHEPGDLTVCPICDILYIYYIKNFVKSQKIFMYLAVAGSVVSLTAATRRGRKMLYLGGTTGWNQTNDLAGHIKSTYLQRTSFAI